MLRVLRTANSTMRLCTALKVGTRNHHRKCITQIREQKSGGDEVLCRELAGGDFICDL